MIDLRTGVPGSGKTLSAVESLAKVLARWKDHPDEGRPIFVHGVKDLALPHAPVPLKMWQTDSDLAKGKPGREVIDWESMPDGSYVLIDECQTLLPPRGSGSEAPPYIAWLNTHRHRGFDITLITQHPKLIDAAARALVGKHQHFRRLFGGQRATCYEWDACSDSLSGLGNAVTSYYAYPKKAFEWYKSAEIHTKQNFRLPKWLFIPIVGVVLGAVAFPLAYGRIKAMANPEAARASIIAHGAASSPAPGALAAGPPTQAAPVTAGILPAIEKVLPKRIVAGCMATPTKCLCVDTDGSTAKVEEAECRVASTTLGGLVPYDLHHVVPKQTSLESRIGEGPAVAGGAKPFGVSGRSPDGQAQQGPRAGERSYGG